ncbi:MAG: hypothetical protein HYZ09_03495 [Candidatus Kerfeldbacteria bacterium]|nr:hypothetical protein [Candidatus Kerfeldbacteria bacterium]
MSIRRDVYGYSVLGEDDVEPGIDFLDHSLEYSEAKPLIETARYRGKIDFQDTQRRNFTLKYNGNGTYRVLKRRESKGFWSGWF